MVAQSVLKPRWTRQELSRLSFKIALYIAAKHEGDNDPAFDLFTALLEQFWRDRRDDVEQELKALHERSDFETSMAGMIERVLSPIRAIANNPGFSFNVDEPGELQ